MIRSRLSLAVALLFTAVLVCPLSLLASETGGIYSPATVQADGQGDATALSSKTSLT